MLLVTDGRLGRRLRTFDVPRYPSGDLPASVLEDTEDRAGVGARRAKKGEAVLFRFRECELVRHHDPLLGAMKPQRAVDPAAADPRLADRELVVMDVDRGGLVLFHHAAETPGGQVRRCARVGIAIRHREFDANEVVRALPVEAVSVLGADHVVRRA